MLSLAVLVACSHAIELDASHPELVELAQQMGERRRGMEWPNVFSQQDKDDILALHNKVRAETARGEYIAATSAGDGTGMLPKANNMVKLKWSDTLAAVASEWAEEVCEGGVRHRGGDQSCKNALADFSSYDFPYTGDGCGENVAGSTYTWASWSTNARGQPSSVKQSVQLAMSQMESRAYTWGNGIYGDDSTDCSRTYCSHYTQIVWADTRYVGCGWFSCSESSSLYRFACNYYPSGNVRGASVYETGGNIGSNCPTGYTKLKTSTYQDQDGEIYDLGKLCVADDDGDDSSNGGGDTSSNDFELDFGLGGDSDDTPCIVVDGWESTGFGGDFEYGEWLQDSNTPLDDNGYIVYKHTHSDFYLYTLPNYVEYTFGKTINEMWYNKGWCTASSSAQADITECSGLWYKGQNVQFRHCNAQPFVSEPCFDDAADLVRFLVDEDEMSEYMQFDLHSDFGCWNEEAVWRFEDESEGEDGNATLHFIHYNADVSAWQITADYVEGEVVFWCEEEALAECTAGTWRALNVTTSEEGVSVGESVLAAATVEMGASAEDRAGLSETDDVAIALVTLLLVGVVGVVLLLWCRSRRNRGKVEVGFEDVDEIEVEQTGNTTR